MEGVMHELVTERKVYFTLIKVSLLGMLLHPGRSPTTASHSNTVQGEPRESRDVRREERNVAEISKVVWYLFVFHRLGINFYICPSNQGFTQR